MLRTNNFCNKWKRSCNAWRLSIAVCCWAIVWWCFFLHIFHAFHWHGAALTFSYNRCEPWIYVSYMDWLKSCSLFSVKFFFFCLYWSRWDFIEFSLIWLVGVVYVSVVHQTSYYPWHVRSRVCSIEVAAKNLFLSQFICIHFHLMNSFTHTNTAINIIISTEAYFEWLESLHLDFNYPPWCCIVLCRLFSLYVSRLLLLDLINCLLFIQW